MSVFDKLQQSLLALGFFIGVALALIGVACLFPLIGGGIAIYLESLVKDIDFTFPMRMDQVLALALGGTALLVAGIMLAISYVRYMYAMTRKIVFGLGFAACGIPFFSAAIVLQEGAADFRLGILAMGIGLLCLAGLMIFTALRPAR